MGVWLAAREPGRGTATRYAGIPTLLFFCVHIARALFYRKNPVFSMKPGNAEAISNKPARQEFPAAPALQPSRQPPSVTDGKKVYAVDNKDLLDRPKFKSANLTETIEEVFPLTVVPALSCERTYLAYFEGVSRSSTPVRVRDAPSGSAALRNSDTAPFPSLAAMSRSIPPLSESERTEPEPLSTVIT